MPGQQSDAMRLPTPSQLSSKPASNPASAASRRLSIAALCFALLLAAYWRIPPASSALLFGDEFHSLRRLAFGYDFLFTNYSTTGSGMALPLLQRGLADLFGSNHWTIRGPALLGGLALVASLYPLGRRLVGRNAALIATFLAAGSSILIYYSHFGRAYSLMAWLCLLLVYSLQRILESDGPSTRYSVYCAGLIAALPYVHLSSLATVLAVVGAALVVLWLEGRLRESAHLAGAAALGLALSLALHAPAQASFVAFVSDKTTRAYYGEFGFWDVAALLTGGRMAAILMVPLLLFALTRIALRHGARALPLAAACLSPALALVIVRPYGDAYAYARYAITIVPFVCLALGWLINDGFGGSHEAESAKAVRGRSHWVLGAGALLACVLFAAGPYGVRHPNDGPHANTYLSLYSLPAFDEPWDGAPAFYQSLANATKRPRIIEVPALVNRTRHLYRDYYLQHGAETWLGLFPRELRNVPDGPYVSLANPGWREAAEADYLILHTNLGEELRDYWRFVYESQGHDVGSAAVAAYMTRHSRFGEVAAQEPALLAPRLRSELGEPAFEDRYITVWELDPP